MVVWGVGTGLLLRRVRATAEVFSELLKLCGQREAEMSDCPTDFKLELKDVVLAVKDITEWHDLGLQLGIPDGTLKLIASHPDIGSHRRMMLSEWLQFDTKATWGKLATALETMGKRVVAEKIRRQFVGVRDQDLESEANDRKTRKSLLIIFCNQSAT